MLRDEMITVFGGSGFIGRYVVRELARQGYRVRVATRRPNLAYELKPMGVPGQIQLAQANLRNKASVARAVEGASGVVNLVGILYESGGQTFSGLQERGARTVAANAGFFGLILRSFSSCGLWRTRPMEAMRMSTASARPASRAAHCCTRSSAVDVRL